MHALPAASTHSQSLVILAWVSIGLAAACAAAIAIDIAAGRQQQMAVMNVVWPLTALYGGPLALLAYLTIGRGDKSMYPEAGDRRGEQKRASGEADDINHGQVHRGRRHMKHPMWQSALLGATHCGAGCMLGDVLTDGGLFLLGGAALLGSALLTSYVFDFIAAYLIGIIFQYFAIAPMRSLSLGEGIVAAIKADTLSLIAFQIGMYAWMAIYQTAIFHPRLEANSPVFWLMMQVGMLAGLATAYPMNWFLVSVGIKEAM